MSLIGQPPVYRKLETVATVIMPSRETLLLAKSDSELFEVDFYL